MREGQLELSSCQLCPRMCRADRENGQTGYCKVTSEIYVARAALHFWEEPCISGTKGSGAVFFSGCNMGCVFCQNYEIANKSGHYESSGKKISISRLAEIFLELQDQGAENINLVTPTHYVLQIVAALEKAKLQGLAIPIVYNSSGYERVETLKMLEGIIDIYLPDCKYMNSTISAKYSNAKDYFSCVIPAIDEMVRQQPKADINERGMMEKGVIVRHLQLPGQLMDSKHIVRYLHERYGEKIYLSIMSQYTPVRHIEEYPELNEKVKRKNYQKLIDYAIEIGVTQAFIQEGGVAKESFIPKFDGTGVDKC